MNKRRVSRTDALKEKRKKGIGQKEKLQKDGAGKEAKRTLRQDIALVWRGCKILYEICPVGMIWSAAKCIVQQLWPYVALYMSAFIIDEIVAGAGFKRLLTLAFVTVALQLFLSGAGHLLRCKEEETESLRWSLIEMYFLKVQCRMQFKHFDDPDTALLRHRIRHHSNYGGHGLNRLYWTYVEVLNAGINIILSVALTASMLKMSVETEYEGFLGFVNSPVSSVVILLVIGIQVAAQLVNVHYFEPKRTEILGEYNKRFARANWYMNWQADGKIFNSEKLSLSRVKDVLVKDAG